MRHFLFLIFVFASLTSSVSALEPERMSLLDSVAFRFYCRMGVVFSQDIQGCALDEAEKFNFSFIGGQTLASPSVSQGVSPIQVIQQVIQTVIEKPVETVTYVQGPAGPQGEKGDMGDAGLPGVTGGSVTSGLGTLPIWIGLGSTGGGSVGATGATGPAGANGTTTTIYVVASSTEDIDATGTITTLNLLATNATTTNLFSSNANFDNLIFGNATGTNLSLFNNFSVSGITTLSTTTFSALPTLPLSFGSLLIGNVSNFASPYAAGATGTVLSILNGTPTWVATSSLGFASSITNTASTSGNVLTTTVNGVVATSSLIGNNTLTFSTSTGLFTSDINGVIGTTTLSLADLPGLVNLTSQISGVLPITNGGTGTSTAPALGQLLMGDGLGGYNLVATSSLGISSTPAGSNKQFQFNSSSLFAGSANLTQETDQILITGSSSGTVPFVVKGATSQTAHLQDWKSSTDAVKAYVDSDGRFHPAEAGGYNASSILYLGALDNNIFLQANTRAVRLGTDGGFGGGIGRLEFGTGGYFSGDTFISRDAANQLGMRNGTTGQTWRVYNTYTDSTTFERGVMQWDTNVLELGTEKGSVGGTARGLALQTDGTTRLAISATVGDVTIGNANYNPVTYGAGGANSQMTMIFGGAGVAFWNGTLGFSMANSLPLNLSTGGVSSAPNVSLFPDAADTLALRRSTNAQTFRVYNTFTSSTNYERGVMQWDTNVLEIGTEKGSGGGTARGLALQTDATTRLSIASSGAITFNNAFTFPTTDGASNQILQTNGAGVVSWASAGGSPAGSSTQLQFNNGGAFGATSTLVWDNSANGRLGIGTTSPISVLAISTRQPAITLRNSFNGQTYQIRNGVSTSVGDDTFKIMNLTSGATPFMIQSDGNIAIGSSTIPNNNSRLFVYGGGNGANIDVRGDPGVSDQAVIELEGSDYDTTPNSVRLQYYGPNGIGTTAGFNNQRLGMLAFQGADNALIGTIDAKPLIFFTDFAEKMRLTETGRLGIGTTTPTAKLSIVNSSSTQSILELSSASGQVNPMVLFRESTGTELVRINATGTSLFVGRSAGSAVTTTENNTFFGQDAGAVNIGGRFNSFFGSSAGAANTSGSANAFFGRSAGISNDIGANNSFFGHGAGASNTSGGSNAFFGQGAGDQNSTGGNNSFFGTGAGAANATGTANSFFGQGSGAANTFGINNSFFGIQSGNSNLTGQYNSFFGDNAGDANTTGNFNIFIGRNSAISNTTGSNNIVIGTGISLPSATQSNSLSIGNLIYGTGVDGAGTATSTGNIGIGTSSPATKLQVFGDVRVGDSGTNGCVQRFDGAALAGTCTSDQNLKKDVTYLDNVLSKVVALKPSTYSWNEVAVNKYKYAANTAITGLIAQDVETVFPHLVSVNSDGFKVVDSQPLVYYTLEAIRELNAKLGDLSIETNDITQFSASLIWKKMALTFESLGVKISQGLVSFKDIVAEKFTAKEVKTEMLCVGNTCVTETEFMRLLQNTGVAGANTPITQIQEPFDSMGTQENQDAVNEVVTSTATTTTSTASTTETVLPAPETEASVEPTVEVVEPIITEEIAPTIGESSVVEEPIPVVAPSEEVVN